MKKNFHVTNVKEGYIVSLTTYGYRIKTVYYTICSLLDQEVNCHICLWISIDERNNKWIKRLERIDNSLFCIKFCNDLMSYKKFYYAVSEGDYNIITVDDDVFYPKYFLKGLITSFEETNKKFVCCYRARNIAFDANNSFKKYNQWNIVYTDGKKSLEAMNLLPIGVGGVLYPNDFFRKNVMDINGFQKVAPHGDDIWLRFAGVRNKYKVLLVPSKISNWITIPFSQKKALFKTNLCREENDKQIRDTSIYFGLKMEEFYD
jgi:hypothetical protein